MRKSDLDKGVCFRSWSGSCVSRFGVGESIDFGPEPMWGRELEPELVRVLVVSVARLREFIAGAICPARQR